jgi:hypothetical protein
MILEWVDKKDGDYIDPNDINKVAKGVQSLEKLIDDTKSSSVQKTKNGSSIYATNEKGEEITVRYAPNAEADTVAYRDENGNIGVSSPVQEQDATNKHYVDSVSIGLKNSFSNALKGNASGKIVRIDDVSPLAPDIVVKVSGVEDVSAVKVQRWGKNLFNNDTNKIAKVNYIGQSGSVGARYGYAIHLPAGTYTAHAQYREDLELTFDHSYVYGLINTKDGAFVQAANLSQADSTFTVTATLNEGDVWYIYDGIASHTETLAKKLFKGVDIQFEPGTTVTDFAPYIAPTEYAVNEDGTVDGVTALFPTTTITTDTAGAIIECEYNRDINKAFAELQQAIISMGGNV